MVCPWLMGNLRSAADLKKNGITRKLSIIIPAKNDAVNLRKLLPTLLSTVEEMAQIIVVDMGSEDNTASIVRGYGCELVSLTDKPDHSSMRNYACYMGAKKSVNEMLVFMDANLLPGKELFEKLDYAVKKNYVLSILPYDKFEKGGGIFGGLRRLVSVMLMGSFALLKREDAGLFEPFVMIDRHDYFNICTHDMIKENAFENLILGQAYKKAGMKIKNYIGGSELRRRRSLNKHLSGQNLSARNIAFDYTSVFLVLLFLTGGVSICYHCIASLVSGSNYVIWLWFYAAFGAAYEYFLRKIGEYPLYCALIYPLHILTFVVGTLAPALIFSLKPHKIKWRGRKLKIEKRGKKINESA